MIELQEFEIVGNWNKFYASAWSYKLKELFMMTCNNSVNLLELSPDMEFITFFVSLRVTNKHGKVGKFRDAPASVCFLLAKFCNLCHLLSDFHFTKLYLINKEA